MKIFSKISLLVTVVAILFSPVAYRAYALGPKVSEEFVTGNKHNLSARAWTGGSYTGINPNTYKATDDPTGNPKGQQICIFCHTPHSANVEGGAPLWNRKYSTTTFSRFSSQTVQIRVDSGARAAAEYDSVAWKPDGSTKLCLSCHDGVSSLGAVLNGGPIAMNAGDTITTIASFDPASNNKMKLGHHPVSFVYNQAVADAINLIKGPGDTYKLPPDVTVPEVKLDKNSKMQCTTCHNAHQNQSHDEECYGGTCDNTVNTRKKAPFWVHGGGVDAPTDRDAVCAVCHNLTPGAITLPSWP